MIEKALNELSARFRSVGIIYFNTLHEFLRSIGEDDAADEATKTYDKIATIMNELKDKIDKLREKLAEKEKGK